MLDAGVVAGLVVSGGGGVFGWGFAGGVRGVFGWEWVGRRLSGGCSGLGGGFGDGWGGVSRLVVGSVSGGMAGALQEVVRRVAAAPRVEGLEPASAGLASAVMNAGTDWRYELRAARDHAVFGGREWGLVERLHYFGDQRGERRRLFPSKGSY